MDYTKVWENLVLDDGKTILYIILDGLGGLPLNGKSELQAANIPNLDRLAKESSCGLIEIIGPGITPGSGPGHLSLFGYDPIVHDIGRGIFSALGIDFDLKEGDVAARINFASMGKDGKITDRRAGRIETSLNENLCEKIRQNVDLEDVEFFLETESEHRAALILRGAGLEGSIEDTDPQSTGLKALDPKPKNDNSRKTAKIVEKFIHQAKEAIKDEEPANMILLRGFDTFRPVAGLKERFKLNGLCIADYPMYRGVSRFLGMEALPSPGGIKNEFRCLQENFGKSHNFCLTKPGRTVILLKRPHPWKKSTSTLPRSWTLSPM